MSPEPPRTEPERKRSLTGPLKIAAAIAALGGAVFALTVIRQNTPPPKVTGPDTTDIVKYNVPQLRYDSRSENPWPALHHFPGFYEIGTSELFHFWCENPNPFPVKVSTRGRSCTTCTEAWIAPFNQPSDTDPMLPAAAMLGGSVFSDPDRYAEDIWERAARKLPGDRWMALDFNNPDNPVMIPAADPATGPTRFVLRMKLLIKAGVHMPDPNGNRDKDASIRADLAFGDVKSPATMNTRFSVSYIGVAPFDINPPQTALGEMAAATQSRTFDLTVFSMIRPDLPPPTFAADRKDPFLSFGEPVKLNEAERDAFAALQQIPPARMRAAYRTTVTLNRREPEGKRELGLGPLDASFTVGVPGIDYTAQATVKATVQGIVGLEGGATVIDFGDFSGHRGTTKTVRLVSENPALELELVPEEFKPAHIQGKLGAPSNDGDRRFWTLALSIGAGQSLGSLPPDGTVSLRVKGTGQSIRIPVKGQGKLTGH